MKITQAFTFEAAHRLPNVPGGHKCKNMHGHSYRMELTFESYVHPVTGFVADFFDIERAVAPLLKQLDHHTLNEIDGLANPTAENIALFVAARLGKWCLGESSTKLRTVRIYETPMCWAEETLND